MSVCNASQCKVFEWIQQEAISNVKYVMPRKSKMAPEVFDEAGGHKTVVKDRQPNQQSIKNVIQMRVIITKK